ncbi:MAG TPA: hypothetical protein VKB53_06715 [Gammaproteobacteria bacterium]|jgi:hypothetical protein|nr:hypothetical protein [Gammaproteobacteria bacterium]HKH20562.1 hypothetical protein [Gammaproteobacteria bacterium]
MTVAQDRLIQQAVEDGFLSLPNTNWSTRSAGAYNAWHRICERADLASVVVMARSKAKCYVELNCATLRARGGQLWDAYAFFYALAPLETKKCSAWVSGEMAGVTVDRSRLPEAITLFKTAAEKAKRCPLEHDLVAAMAAELNKDSHAKACD